MEHIKKSIYKQPGMRHALKPLWPAWILVGVGAVCGAAYAAWPNLSTGVGSTLLFMAALGAMCLALVVCYWLFGDSRRPYSRALHALLEPTYAYYLPGTDAQLRAALEAGDEAALDAVRRTPGGSLVLVRYSDRDERVFYSQILDGTEPVSDIFVNQPQKKN